MGGEGESSPSRTRLFIAESRRRSPSTLPIFLNLHLFSREIRIMSAAPRRNYETGMASPAPCFNGSCNSSPMIPTSLKVSSSPRFCSFSGSSRVKCYGRRAASYRSFRDLVIRLLFIFSFSSKLPWLKQIPPEYTVIYIFIF